VAVKSASGVNPDQENVVYVGPGATLKGEISVSDTLVVDGVVEGDVNAAVVIVSPSGVVRGKISAIEADISGSVTDHIEIEQLLLVRSTGHLVGRAIFGEIELEKGAVVIGDLASADKSPAVAKRSAKPSSQPQLRIAASTPSESIDEEEEEEQEDFVPTAPAQTSARGAIYRLNETVRAAKSSGVGKPSMADEAGKRAALLRSPLRRPKRPE
jgi:cytoskeletal protein CcmA (bactofilin family)